LPTARRRLPSPGSGITVPQPLAQVDDTGYTDTETEAEATYTDEVTAENAVGEAEDCPTAEVTAIPFFADPALSRWPPSVAWAPSVRCACVAADPRKTGPGRSGSTAAAPLSVVFPHDLLQPV
jgi:hypothetical protein